MDSGARRLILCGALGGRSDQVLGHMTMAVRLARSGICTCLVSGEEEGYPLYPGSHHFDLPHGCLFSLIGFGNLDCVTIKGAKWCLDEASLPFGYGIAISNIAVAPLTVALKGGEGMLLANYSERI